jgi:hypothetical protein
MSNSFGRIAAVLRCIGVVSAGHGWATRFASDYDAIKRPGYRRHCNIAPKFKLQRDAAFNLAFQSVWFVSSCMVL